MPLFIANNNEIITVLLFYNYFSHPILGLFSQRAFYVCPSVCPHISAWFPLDGFLWNLILSLYENPLINSKFR